MTKSFVNFCLGSEMYQFDMFLAKFRQFTVNAACDMYKAKSIRL